MKLLSFESVVHLSYITAECQLTLNTGAHKLAIVKALWLSACQIIKLHIRQTIFTRTPGLIIRTVEVHAKGIQFDDLNYILKIS